MLADGGDGSHLQWGRRGLRGRSVCVIGHRIPLRALMAGQTRIARTGHQAYRRLEQAMEQFVNWRPTDQSDKLAANRVAE